MENPPPAPVAPRRRFVDKLVARLLPAADASASRLRRRKAFVSALTGQLSRLIFLLFFLGHLWILAIPLPQLGRGTYIDENALQPGQVTPYWNWGEVHAADNYLAALENLRSMNATDELRAQFIQTEFSKLGITASTQKYTLSTSIGEVTGSNSYGIIHSPRTAETEAIVISASWMSRSGVPNLRGVATVLALAGFLKRYSLWAKDIILVISDEHLDGMQAWLAAYHGASQTTIRAEPLGFSSGVIWTALNIDYPGHSFSHLGVFFEGINGRLPNQDLLNSFQRISLYTGGVPVVLNDHIDSEETISWLPRFLREQDIVRQYVYQARNVVHQFKYQTRGRPSGVHGLFHQYRIDAFTLFAVPAVGPHGFHAIGRVVESTLRTANNLLERLHASFFFYVLTSPDRFIKIGNYLPSAVLISIAMMFSGLRAWVDASWTRKVSSEDKKNGSSTTSEWLKRPRPTLQVLGIVISTYFAGATLLGLLTTTWFANNQKLATPLVFITFGLVPLLAFVVSQGHMSEAEPLSKVLKAFNLCFASTVISIMCVLNFPLAAALAILLGLPLSLASSNGALPTRIMRYLIYTIWGFGWLFLHNEVRDAIWDWEMLAVWFTPFVCLIYVPLVLQGGLVCLLPS